MKGRIYFASECQVSIGNFYCCGAENVLNVTVRNMWRRKAANFMLDRGQRTTSPTPQIVSTTGDILLNHKIRIISKTIHCICMGEHDV